jgi:hypothetical protein
MKTDRSESARRVARLRGRDASTRRRPGALRPALPQTGWDVLGATLAIVRRRQHRRLRPPWSHPVSRELNEEFLVGWHDSLFETSKRILREDGYLAPLVWMLTYFDLVPSDFRGELRPLGSQQPGRAPTDGDLVMMCLPISYHPDALCGVIRDHVLTDGGRDLFKMAAAHAKQLRGYSLESMNESFVRAICEKHDLTPGDLVAIRIRAMLRRSGAVAYVKQDDSWHLNLQPGEERKDHPRKLEDDPRATEAIISEMEHSGGARVIVLPYERRQRGAREVKPFGAATINTFPRGSDRFKGRFAWLLPERSREDVN